MFEWIVREWVLLADQALHVHCAIHGNIHIFFLFSSVAWHALYHTCTRSKVHGEKIANHRSSSTERFLFIVSIVQIRESASRFAWHHLNECAWHLAAQKKIGSREIDRCSTHEVQRKCREWHEVKWFDQRLTPIACHVMRAIKSNVQSARRLFTGRTTMETPGGTKNGSCDQANDINFL